MRTVTIVGGSTLLFMLAGAPSAGTNAQAPPSQGPPPASQAAGAGRGPARPPLLPTPALTAAPTPDADGNFVIGPPTHPRPS